MHETSRVGGAAPSDRVLARRAGLGDRAAFEELFARLFPATLRYALRMLGGDQQGAEDVAQEAWTKAWKGLPDFQGTSAVSTWLFSIVTHEAISQQRRRRPTVLADDVLEPLASGEGPGTGGIRRPDRTPEQAALDRELWETLTLALRQLPWRQRASWLLYELEGLRYAEIADVLGTTETVVRGQLHRARRTLATRMEEWR